MWKDTEPRKYKKFIISSTDLVLLEILVLWKSVYIIQCFDWEVFHEGVSEKQGLSWKVRLFFEEEELKMILFHKPIQS